MKIFTLSLIFRKFSGLGEKRIGSMRKEKNSIGPFRRLIRTGMSLTLVWGLAGVLLCASNACWAQHRFGGPHQAAFRGGFRAPQNRGGQRAAGGRMEMQSRPQSNMQRRPGQQHLPEWWQSHRNLSPQQQADALRREPGFRNLPQGQQQRLLNRLHTFDQRSPAQQQRMMERNEMFERLSPERQQEVRGAAQSLSRMSPDRQAALRHAFQQLRGMPPEQRQQMLNSSYGSQFSPQERTVLGNMLSIEPYQPHIAEPYFGRP